MTNITEPSQVWKRTVVSLSKNIFRWKSVKRPKFQTYAEKYPDSVFYRHHGTQTQSRLHSVVKNKHKFITAKPRSLNPDFEPCPYYGTRNDKSFYVDFDTDGPKIANSEYTYVKI